MPRTLQTLLWSFTAIMCVQCKFSAVPSNLTKWSSYLRLLFLLLPKSWRRMLFLHHEFSSDGTGVINDTDHTSSKEFVITKAFWDLNLVV